VRRNQEIIHSQWDEPLQEFPDVPVLPPVPGPYTSLTPTELAACGMFLLIFSTMTMRSRPTMRRRRTTSSRYRIFASQLFYIVGVLMTKGEKRVISISVFYF
jgi:hypothetical protein